MKRTMLALTLASASLLAAPAFAQDSAMSGMQSDTQADPGGNYQPSQPVGSGNWFIGANVGRTNDGDGGFGSNASDFNFFDGNRGRRTGYGVLGGYRWKVGQDLGLGLEVGYTDLGNYRLRNVFNSDPVNERSSTNALRGWMVGVNGRINLTPHWYLGAHGGLFWANDNSGRYYDTISQDLGFSDGDRPGRGGSYVGIGTGRDVNEHFGIGVRYDYFHAQSGHYRNPATGAQIDGLDRSTGIVSLAGEYRF